SGRSVLEEGVLLALAPHGAAHVHDLEARSEPLLEESRKNLLPLDADPEGHGVAEDEDALAVLPGERPVVAESEGIGADAEGAAGRLAATPRLVGVRGEPEAELAVARVADPHDARLHARDARGDEELL